MLIWHTPECGLSWGSFYSPFIVLFICLVIYFKLYLYQITTYIYEHGT